MQYIIILSIILSLVGCSAIFEKRNVETSFKQEVQLSSHSIEIADTYLKYPFRIRTQDSVLFISDLHAPDYFCHQFSYPEMEYINSFAPRGEAPDEFLLVENIRIENDGSIWLLDPNKKIMTNYDARTKGSQKINLDPELIRTLDFVAYNDSLFIVPDYTGKNRISLIDRNGIIQKSLFKLPLKDNSPTIADAQGWRSFISYNKNNKILAVATQLGQVIELYNMDSEELINIFYGKDDAPKYITKGGYAVPTGVMGYSEVYVGNEAIYALYWGREIKDLSKNQKLKEGGNEIHVFTLDGKPKITYKLDSYITGFFLDESTKTIIGLDVNDNQPIKKFNYE